MALFRYDGPLRVHLWSLVLPQPFLRGDRWLFDMDGIIIHVYAHGQSLDDRPRRYWSSYQGDF